MRKIFKYTAPVSDHFTIELPRGAQFRHIDRDPGRADLTLALWFEIDTDECDKTRRTFYVFGTGHEVSVWGVTFLGTVIMDGFVWHIYEGPF